MVQLLVNFFFSVTPVNPDQLNASVLAESICSICVSAGIAGTDEVRNVFVFCLNLKILKGILCALLKG